jgi:hypothetical protein
MVGVWIEPVIAQLMMVLFAMVVPPWWPAGRPVHSSPTATILDVAAAFKWKIRRFHRQPAAEAVTFCPRGDTRLHTIFKILPSRADLSPRLAVVFASPDRLRKGCALHIG